MVTRVLALILLAGSLLPVANLVPGGESDAAYAARLSDWLLGLSLCVGVGALPWYLGRAAEPPSPSPPPAPELGSDWRFVVGLATGATLLYAGVALWVFDARPLLIDEVVSVLQARDYAAGRLWQPVVEPREFFSLMNLVDVGDRVYGQYPFGGPAMLVPGVLVGAEWAAGPLMGGLCVALFGVLLLRLEPGAPRYIRRATLALFAFAPFGVFMFGSHMNHVSGLLWILAAVAALAAVVATPATDAPAAPWRATALGLALGIAATVRPLDAAAFALPAAVWLLARIRNGSRARGARVAELLLSGVGVTVPLVALAWVNLRTTGHPLRFGYDVLWGAGHSLGFHEAAWGAVHTPQRGVELVSLYLTRLNVYLFETPFPSLLLAAAGLWWARPLAAIDRYLLAASGLLVVGYWAYWHDGYFLGPRFLFPLLPVLVIWSARGVAAILQWAAVSRIRAKPAVAALAVGGLYAVATVLLVRVPTYRNGLQSMRVHPERESARAGVRDAVVLVQESWGAQLMVRMWALGISRSDAEALYRTVDACRLEVALAGLEAQRLRGDVAARALRPLSADSAQLVPSTRSPDFTEREHPGLIYAPICEQRLADDRRGFVLFAPWRLARDSNAYLRWIPGREADALALYPGRAVYRLRRASAAVDAPLVWERLARTARTQ